MTSDRRTQLTDLQKRFLSIYGLMITKIVLSLLLLTGCSKSTTHELSNVDFNIEFTFEGYAVDNGGEWVYFLKGESNGIPVRGDAPLIEASNIFGCPTTMHVESRKGAVRYFLDSGADSEYSREASEKCVIHYSAIFSSLARQRVENAKSYSPD